MKRRAIAPFILAGLLLTTPVAGYTFAGSDPVEDASIVQAAEALYGVTGVTVHAAEGPAFESAFPSMDLYRVVEPTRIPPIVHTMAWRPTTGTAYDVTKNFNDLLLALGTVLGDSETVLRVASALAEEFNPELQLWRTTVNGSHAELLDHAITDPRVTPLLDGWEVDLYTWAPENGIVSYWYTRFDLTTLKEARWNVKGLGKGPSMVSLQSLALREDVRVVNTFSNGHDLAASFKQDGVWQDLTVVLKPEGVFLSPGPTTTERFNPDGSKWVVDYPSLTSDPVPQTLLDLGEALADGAVATYSLLVDDGCFQGQAGEWGFTTLDADCTHQIIVPREDYLACWVCVVPDQQRTQVVISPLFREITSARGSTRTRVSTISRASARPSLHTRTCTTSATSRLSGRPGPRSSTRALLGSRKWASPQRSSIIPARCSSAPVPRGPPSNSMTWVPRTNGTKPS